MRSARYLLTLFATLAVVLGACAGGQPAGGGPSASPGAAKPVSGGTLTFALENDVVDFDPMRSRAFVDRNLHYQIYDSLVRIDSTGKIIPWLAESWETSSDGKQVTFKLRKDVKYHDGTAFDAASVKWNIDRYRTTQGSQRASDLAPVTSVDVVDQSTARFILKTPFAPLVATLVDRAGMMLSQKAVEAGGADFTRKPVGAGSGPFKFVEAVKDDHITIEKNPDWWGRDKDSNKLPYLDKIIVKPIVEGTVRATNLRTGDAQVSNNIVGKDVESVKSEPNLAYQQGPNYGFDSIYTNRKKGAAFEDGRYARAVSMAIDRKQLAEQVFYGTRTPGYGTIAPSHFAADPNFKPFEKADPAGAKALIQQIGKPLQFEMLVTAGSAQDLQIAQLVQAQLLKADIKMDIKTLEFAQILKLQDTCDYQGATLIGWSGRVDPDGNTYSHIYTGAPNNSSCYSNSQVDKLLDESRATSDEAKRKTALRAAEQIYSVDDPARVFYLFRATQLVTTKKVQGLVPYPDGLIRFDVGWLQR
ncbi:MAG: ABC transporter substrate-binding protein [Chloroflexota bacterium]|nr:ABC transporter substrate-binding protein [Chloroflexota bacterium]